MFSLAAIADENFGIGLGGDQLIYIPDDLKHFKALTEGKTVILGHKTLMTFPDKKPLPKRKNIILSHDKNLIVEGAEIVHNIPELLKIAPSNAIVIGGESIYKALLPYTDTAYITYVKKAFAADRFLPDIRKLEDWRLTEESEEMNFDDVKYTYRIYKRK